MRVTLVFILLLVVPSVALPLVLYLSFQEEKQRRLISERQRLRAEAARVEGELAQLVRTPLKRLRLELATQPDLDPRRPTSSAPVVSRAIAREPFVSRAYFLASAGQRPRWTYPVDDETPPGLPWPSDLALWRTADPGGLAGAVVAADPRRVIETGERLATPVAPEAGRTRALARLEQLAPALPELVEPSSPAPPGAWRDPRVRAGALLTKAKLYLRAEADVKRALGLALEPLDELPLGQVDALGRYAVAEGRSLRLEADYLLRQAGGPGSAQRTDEYFRRLMRRTIQDAEAAEQVLPLARLEQLLDDAVRRGGLPDDPVVVEARARCQALLARRAREQELLRELTPLRQQLDRLATLGSDAREDVTDSTPLDLVQLRSPSGRRTFSWVRVVSDRGPLGLIVLELDREAILNEWRQHLGVPLNADGSPADLGYAVALTPAAEPLPKDSASFQTPAPSPLRDSWQLTLTPVGPAGQGVIGELAQGDTALLYAIVLLIVAVGAGVFVTLREARREAKAAQLKSDWVANVTHELKTPLTSIRLFLETLIDGKVDSEEEQRECLSVMNREAERLSRMIEQLLVFSRLEGRRPRLKLGFESPKALVDETILVLADQLGMTPNDLGIEVVTVQDLPRIAVDRVAVNEALLNLLHNAWKYSAGPNRLVRVVITARRREVEIAVEDNGIGVPRRDRRRIFVKFERGTNAERERIEGTGIGLTLANQIAKAHWGRITYSPRKPRGSRFALILPR